MLPSEGGRGHWPLAATDSNAIFDYGGVFHIMHQTPTFPPREPQLRDFHASWGHVVSKDLIHWKRIANALDPGPNGTYDWHDGDCDGWVTLPSQSGFAHPIMTFGPDCARPLLKPNDTPRVGIARPADPHDPLLAIWIKDPKNPIDFGPSLPCSFTGTVWRDGPHSPNTSMVCCVNDLHNAWGRYTTDDPSLHGPWALADPSFATWHTTDGRAIPAASISAPSFLPLRGAAADVASASASAPAPTSATPTHIINGAGGRGFVLGTYNATRLKMTNLFDRLHSAGGGGGLSPTGNGSGYDSTQLVESMDSPANWFVAGKLERDGRVLHIGFMAAGAPGKCIECIQWDDPGRILCPQTAIRELSFDPQAAVLTSCPIREYAGLRNATLRDVRAIDMAPGSVTDLRLPPGAGAELDIVVEVALPSRAEQVVLMGLDVLASPQGQGGTRRATRISLNVSAARPHDGVRVGNLSVHSSRGNATGLRVTSRLVQMLPGEATLDLRVLVDRSIVEVFAARGRAVVSTRDYPSVDETAVRLWTSPHAPLMTHIHRARVWSMECGWVDDI